ncbi:MAG: hypothetical protein PUJ55_00410 [Clostridiales bacterium]|nr:hypothetical protein [Roseburia sp.]MDD7635379.1 hypothetical protein [Clostridiales bacterium]
MVIVTFKKDTKEVISVCPIDIVSNEDVVLEEQDGIAAQGYDYIIYNGTEPLFENIDGKMYLEENKLLLLADYLEDEGGE